jgi:serine/threonine-protein kinase
VDYDDVVERAEGRTGRVLKGKWTLDKLLGVGGMAAVYAATHRNGNRVAVKMLHPELSRHGNIMERFRREAYVANQVDHPGAVRVSDDDIDDDGSMFLVMDLLEGSSVAHVIDQHGELPAPEVLWLAGQMLDVLGAAHAKGIVHRDIKPDNVFITTEKVVKVLDFGIARLAEGARLTQTGQTMGTPAYMSPEQARGRWDDVDAQSDIWAVGAVMFHALTGRLVHVADTLNEALLAAMTRPAPPVTSVLPDIDSGVAAAIDQALMFDKKQRWPSARAMQSEVLRLQSAAGHATDLGATVGHVTDLGATVPNLLPTTRPAPRPQGLPSLDAPPITILLDEPLPAAMPPRPPPKRDKH